MQQHPGTRQRVDLSRAGFEPGDPAVTLFGETERPARRHGSMPAKPALPFTRRLEHELAERLDAIDTEVRRLKSLEVEASIIRRALRALGHRR